MTKTVIVTATLENVTREELDTFKQIMRQWKNCTHVESRDA